LQQEKPNDYVIGTGETHSVREFVEEAFKCININIQWRGKDVNEEGFDAITGRVWVKVDERFFRPTEVEVLCANPEKAYKILGWKPKTTFHELVSTMMKHDLKEAGISL
jgi:GDPmannose 4,6-dehydratase